MSPVMNSLAKTLQEEILLRLDPKSLAMMRCTNKYFEHITKDPNFKSRYWSWIGSSLLHISECGSNFVCFNPVGDTRPFQTKGLSEIKCFIIGYCSGLLLISVYECFCIANPLTKKFRFLDYYKLKRKKKNIGFVVDQIDKTTQRFKIVCVTDLGASNPDETVYGFQIYAGDSWRVSKTKITCLSSDLMKPVYFQGGLYWLRSDGKMLTFNPRTEEARLIPTKFDQEMGAKLLLGADGNSLTLISATEEMVNVYALENIFTDPKWILTRSIGNEPVHGRMQLSWSVVAFDGRHVLVRTKDEISDVVIHGYDLRENMWEVVGLLPKWCDTNRVFYQFKPSWSSVIGLPGQSDVPARYKSQREVAIEGIMELINGHFRI